MRCQLRVTAVGSSPISDRANLPTDAAIGSSRLWNPSPRPRIPASVSTTTNT